MRRTQFIFSYLIFLIAFLAIAESGCGPTAKALWYNAPGLKDYEIFPLRKIEAPEATHQLISGYEEPIPDISEWGLGKRFKEGMTLEEFFKATGTVAFLALRNDTIVHELYRDDYTSTSIFNTFSIAKVFISALTGIAIDDGYIDSVDQKVADFLPEFRQEGLDQVTVRHLLLMTSGLSSHEGLLDPFSRTIRLYYGKNLRKVLHPLKLKYDPGQRFEYLNLNTQILGFVLTEATGKSISEYMEEKIWKPAEMEFDAYWSLDEENGMEKTFCCINAMARDYARFGLLFLNKGRYKDKQIIPEWWISESVGFDTSDGSSVFYQYSWRSTPAEEDFYGEGLEGQFIYVAPEKNMVYVRIGQSLQLNPWYYMFRFLAGLEEKPREIEMPVEQMEALEGEYVFQLSQRGDSGLYGKKAWIEASPRGLLVRSEVNKTYYAVPGNDSMFFHLDDMRRLFFRKDEQGEVESVRWHRRGNEWILLPAAKAAGEASPEGSGK